MTSSPLIRKTELVFDSVMLAELPKRSFSSFTSAVGAGSTLASKDAYDQTFYVTDIVINATGASTVSLTDGNGGPTKYQKIFVAAGESEIHLSSPIVFSTSVFGIASVAADILVSGYITILEKGDE